MPTDAGPLTPVCSSPDRRLAWAVLARAALTAPTAVERLLATTDVEDAAHQLVDGYETFSVSADLRERAVRDLDRADAVAARLLTREEFEWPAARLAGLGTPGVGGRMPVALWLRGPARLNAFSGHSVAVIGARASTQYGNTVAHDFAGHFAQRGWTVLSGGAFGIDAAAHHAALAQDGATVAVMATGIDRYYPAGNQKLLTRIAEHGLLVSEYPPGETASRDRFLERNRLVAALAAGVVVIEAGRRSGTLDTARWAHRLTRPVFATPGSIYSAASDGVHDLLRQHKATAVTHPDHVIDAITRPEPTDHH
ncbi:DNA-processing protein DprA [Nocardia shimofusensis]|uniref:DNA-processing protein DprA n=1 Tax=Nocardia shimofusensis TaxID=228596 RepID=UPI0008336512|nr:DNA-processing protein DprA [Nocardia shimofusensis]